MLNNLGYALLSQKNLPEAADAFMEAFYIEPRNDPAYKNAIIILRTLKRYDEVIRVLNHKLGKDRSDPGVLQDLAVILYEQGKTEEALLNLDRSLELLPDNTTALMTRGELMLAIDKPHKALIDLSRAVKVERRRAKGENPKLLIKLAIAQSRTGRETEAMINLLRVLKAAKSEEAASAIGELMGRLGHTPEAAKSYEKVLRVFPGWIEGLQTLAWIRATHPDPAARNSRQALEAAGQLVKRVGERNAVAMDTYAAALAEGGKFPEALTAARKALQVAKDSKNDLLARRIERRIELYSNGKAYREGK